MTSSLPEVDLAKWCQLRSNQIEHVRLGVERIAKANVSVSDFVTEVVSDRLSLAAKHLRSAKRLQEIRGEQRSAISRAYYCMYNSARAIVFFKESGDIDDHKKVAEKLPEDFPDAKTWAKRLTNARLARNNADYSPYPRKAPGLNRQCRDILTWAELFLKTVKGYLAAEGLVKS